MIVLCDPLQAVGHVAAVLSARFGRPEVTLHIVRMWGINVNEVIDMPVCLKCAPTRVAFVTMETYDFEDRSVTVGTCPSGCQQSQSISVVYGALVGGSVRLMDSLDCVADYTTKVQRVCLRCGEAVVMIVMYSFTKEPMQRTYCVRTVVWRG